MTAVVLFLIMLPGLPWGVATSDPVDCPASVAVAGYEAPFPLAAVSFSPSDANDPVNRQICGYREDPDVLTSAYRTFRVEWQDAAGAVHDSCARPGDMRVREASLRFNSATAQAEAGTSWPPGGTNESSSARPIVEGLLAAAEAKAWPCVGQPELQCPGHVITAAGTWFTSLSFGPAPNAQETLMTMRCGYAAPEGSGLHAIAVDLNWRAHDIHRYPPRSCGRAYDDHHDLPGTRWVGSNATYTGAFHYYNDTQRVHQDAVVSALMDVVAPHALACPEPEATDGIRLRGRVATLNATNGVVSIPHAKVQVIIRTASGGSDRVHETTTDARGVYDVRVPFEAAGGAYTVQVTLQEQNGWVAVHDARTFGADPVTITLADVPLPDPVPDTVIAHLKIGGRFLDTYAAKALLPDGSTRALTDFDAARLRHAAAAYAYATEAARFAVREWGVTYDHELPVKVMMGDSGGNSFYRPTDGDIRISAPAGHDNITGGYWPTVGWHEFAHHLHEDAAMGGDNGKARNLEGFTSHGGYDNPDSRASVTEGFAVWYPAVVGGGPCYRIRDMCAHLERDVVMKDGRPNEEWLVASLLWDLMDDGPDVKGGIPRDNITMSAEAVWRVLDDPSTSTVTSIYDNLRARHVFGTFAPRLNETHVDDLFVNHLLFSDANGNGRRDPDEEVGFSDFWESGNTGPNPVVRESILPERGTNATFAAVDARGTPVRLEALELEVLYREPYYDTRQIVVAAPAAVADAGTRFSVDVPLDVREVRLTPLVAGHDAAPLVLSGVEYAAAVAAAADGDGTFLHHTFKLTSLGLDAPTNVTATGSSNAWTLGWTPPPDAASSLVVRGYERPPAHPADGDVVHRGKATTVTDRDAPEAGDVHYAVFALDVEGRASHPTVVGAWQPDDASVATGLAASTTPVTGDDVFAAALVDGDTGDDADAAEDDAGDDAGGVAARGGGGSWLPWAALAVAGILAAAVAAVVLRRAG